MVVKGIFKPKSIFFSFNTNILNNSGKSRFMIDNKFYYYRMWCKDHKKYNIDLGGLAERQKWKQNTKKYKFTHDDGTVDEVVIEPFDKKYFGKIIRSKPKMQHFGKHEGEGKISDLKTDMELVGEKERDITYFAFMPYGMYDLLFLTEIHFGNRGMNTIKDFFTKCNPVNAYEFKSEPLKTPKLLDLKKYAPKELKKIFFTFRREPIVPEKLGVEDVIKRLRMQEDYQIIVGAKIRLQKNEKNVFVSLENAFEKLFGKGLTSAIDEGIDIPEILSSIDVAFKDATSNKTTDILKDYEREAIHLQKGNLEDKQIRETLFEKLTTKLTELKKNG